MVTVTHYCVKILYAKSFGFCLGDTSLEVVAISNVPAFLKFLNRF